jgi:nitrite reductase/ring-hydroxylating ferredoxin subunit
MFNFVNMIISSKIRFFLFTLIISVILFSCKENTEENPVPSAYVNFSLYLNDPEYQELKIPGNFVFVRSGSVNVVIYRISNDEFVAFDRMCTYEAKETCLVVSDSSSAIVKCSCCNSKFILVDGTPLANQSAVHSLRPYNVTYDGGDYIHVSNQ